MVVEAVTGTGVRTEMVALLLQPVTPVGVDRDCGCGTGHRHSNDRVIGWEPHCLADIWATTLVLLFSCPSVHSHVLQRPWHPTEREPEW